MQVVPIVLASDKNCIKQMYATILSAVLNKNKNTFYDFYCLIPSKFSKYVASKFSKLEKKFNNVKINFRPMGSDFGNLEMQIGHITTPTFYRLKIAEILPDYKKAIWLDIDTIVLDDLSLLFNENIDEYYIAGVHTVGDEVQKELNNKDFHKELNLKYPQNYVNAGVLLWNLDKIRQDNKTEELLNLAKNNYPFMDQDIINIAFNEKTKLLDLKYNFLVFYKKLHYDVPKNRQIVEKYIDKTLLENAIKNPVILHWASDEKPWCADVEYSDFWFYYAKKIPFGGRLNLINSAQKKFVDAINSIKNKKIVIWGASLFLEYLLKKGQIKNKQIKAIIDKDPKKTGKKLGGITIISPEDLSKISCDVVICAIKHHNKDVYAQIKDFLNKNHPKIEFFKDIF